MASGFATNSKHIAKFEAQPFPRAMPANAVTQAFERGAYAKIVSEPDCLTTETDAHLSSSPSYAGDIQFD